MSPSTNLILLGTKGLKFSSTYLSSILATTSIDINISKGSGPNKRAYTEDPLIL